MAERAAAAEAAWRTTYNLFDALDNTARPSAGSGQLLYVEEVASQTAWPAC